VTAPTPAAAIAPARAGLALAQHVLALADDAHLSGHPEFEVIVSEARALVRSVRAPRVALVSKDRYVRSHGRAPRGEGYWIFEDRDGYLVWAGTALYSDAARAASAEARDRGISSVWVAP
jgi:hypothetical protein